MSLFRLVLTGMLQSPMRFALSALSVAAAVAGLTLVRTVSNVWREAVASSSEDRLIVRSSLASGEPLPIAYLEEARKAEPEIRAVALRWSVDVVTGEERARRMTVMQGESSERTLRAEQRVLTAFGLTPGQTVRLRTREGKSDERVVVLAQNVVDRVGLVAEVGGFSEGRESADEILLDLSNASIAPEVKRRIDALFAERPIPTLTQSARDTTREVERSLQDVFAFIDVLSLAILVVIGVVVALTIAFSTRERTMDYAVLRALGFSPTHVVLIVACEAMLVCASGALAGAIIAASGAFALGSLLARAMPELLPSYGFSPSALVSSVVAAAGLCLLAAIAPALSASRVEAAAALRH